MMSDLTTLERAAMLGYLLARGGGDRLALARVELPPSLTRRERLAFAAQ
jgi:hypothetical protein